MLQQEPNKSTKLPPKSQTAFESAEACLKKGGYDYEKQEIKNRVTDRVFFFIGDFHDKDYRRELPKVLDHLIKNGNLKSVGFEGVWGPARPDILEDRYKLLGKLLGDKEATIRKDREKELFSPIADFLKQKIKINSGTETIAAFGLEDKDTFTKATFVFEQRELLKEFLTRLNEVASKNPKLNSVESILGEKGDPKAKELENKLLDLNKRVKDDEELNKLISKDIPRYSREALTSTKAVITYQKNLLDAEQRYLFTGRDLASRDAVEKYSSKNGNTAFSMGWFHLVDVSLNVKTSSIVVHPILPKSPLREEFDPSITAILEALEVRPFSFLKTEKKK